MAIQHKDIGEGNLHEPKGVSTAAAKQIAVADGAGHAVWRTVIDNINISPTGSTTVGANSTAYITFITDEVIQATDIVMKWRTLTGDNLGLVMTELTTATSTTMIGRVSNLTAAPIDLTSTYIVYFWRG